jgi:predicted outer membrane repeat protein
MAVQGGAVNLNHSAAATSFVACRFQGNRARMVPDNGAQALGGAIFTLTTAQGFSLDRCAFLDNQSQGSGGAIYPSTHQPVAIDRCAFIGNQAGLNGGAIRRHNGTTIIRRSSFASNAADQSGGAVFLSSTGMSIGETSFCGNHPTHISGGLWKNLGGVTQQEHCTVAGDLTGDGVVNIDDLLALIAAWGPCPPPPEQCEADVVADGSVNIDDLLLVISHWG